MAQSVSRPPILLVICLLPQQRWLAVFGPQEKRVAFCRNGITVELALLSSFGIVVVIFYLENRTRDDVASVRIECFKFLYNLMHLLPAEGFDGILSGDREKIAPCAGNQTSLVGANDCHRIGIFHGISPAQLRYTVFEQSQHQAGRARNQ